MTHLHELQAAYHAALKTRQGLEEAEKTYLNAKITETCKTLRGARFHKRNNKGELVTYQVCDYEMWQSTSGYIGIDRVQTCKTWMDDNGYRRYSPAHWVMWSRQIDAAITEYRRVHGADK